ncbi:MAG: hypothetical protein JWM48_303 [Mycobacterium sp.]|nr:hypothetical protein [Mycobacterium sp.]MCW2743753.1 hypothetical protein [Mycobacterium sp.]
MWTTVPPARRVLPGAAPPACDRDRVTNVLTGPRARVRGRGARPAGRTPGVGVQHTSRRGSALLPASVCAALIALGAGLAIVELPVLVAWISDSHTAASPGQALRLGAAVVLVSGGAHLAVPGGTLHMLPLGLTALQVWLLYRGGSRLARTRTALLPTAPPQGQLREVALVTLTFAVAYGALFAALAAISRTSSIRPDPDSALVGGFLLALVSVGCGVLRTAGWHLVADRLPAALRAALAGAATALLAVAAASAALCAIALVAAFPHAVAVARALHPGFGGGLLLTLLQAILVPDVVTWGGAFLAGPGFSVGAGTSVSAAGSTLGELPALPMLAGLPHAQTLPAAAAGLLLIPVAAGTLAGQLVVRRLGAVPHWRAEGTTSLGLRMAGTGALVGVLAGAAAAIACALTGGAAGPGRLQVVGASPWQVGISLAVEVALPATFVTWLLGARRVPKGSAKPAQK